MARVRLTAAARRDLQTIQAEGPSQFGDQASLRHMASFKKIFALLRAYPLAGAMYPAYGEGVRLLVNPPHRILYRVLDGTVVIARILHAARDVRHLVDQRQ